MLNGFCHMQSRCISGGLGHGQRRGRPESHCYRRRVQLLCLDHWLGRSPVGPQISYRRIGCAKGSLGRSHRGALKRLACVYSCWLTFEISARCWTLRPYQSVRARYHPSIRPASQQQHGSSTKPTRILDGPGCRNESPWARPSRPCPIEEGKVSRLCPTHAMRCPRPQHQRDF